MSWLVTQHGMEEGPNFHLCPERAPLVRETEAGVGLPLPKGSEVAQAP